MNEDEGWSFVISTGQSGRVAAGEFVWEFATLGKRNSTGTRNRSARFHDIASPPRGSRDRRTSSMEPLHHVGRVSE